MLGLSLDYAVVYNFYSPFTKLLTYILGLYVSLGLSRWWAIRTYLSTFWGAYENLVMLVGTYIKDDSEENRKVRDTVVRYGLLSHALIYRAAQQKDEVSQSEKKRKREKARARERETY